MGCGLRALIDGALPTPAGDRQSPDARQAGS
jgi:hypothetical protein